MKTLLALAALGFAAWSTHAQGQFTLGNKNLLASPPIGARVFACVGGTLVPVAGTAYLTQAYVKLAMDPESSYAPVGTAVPFRTGANAGDIVSSVVTTPFPGSTPITVQLRAWEAAGGGTYEAAIGAGKLAGSSVGVPLTVTVAPSTPPDMVGLTSFGPMWCVLEPSSLALAALGAVGLLLRRRG